jgi:hypothetical protein
MMKANLVCDVRGVPEVLAAARRALAALLRAAAEDESADVAAFARRVAADFEAGVGEHDG